MGINSRRENLEGMGGFDIANVPDLLTWFKFNTNISTADKDSDGDDDITWTASHTDARTARQTTDAEEPNLVAGYVHFDGSNDNLDLSSDLTLGEFTMFLAIDFDGLSNETVLGKTDDSQMFMRFGFQNLANKFRFRRGNAATNNVDGIMSEDLTIGSVNLITITSKLTAGTSDSTLQIERSTKSGSTITTNQVYEVTDTTFSHTDNLVIDTIGVQTAASAPADMKLYEFVVFSAKVPDAIRANIQQDILNRIG